MSPRPPSSADDPTSDDPTPVTDRAGTLQTDVERAGTVPPRRSRWWIAGATFVGGVLAGVVLVGLLSTGTPDFVQASEDAARNAPTPSAPAPFQVAAQAEVNAACLRVINAAQDISGILSGVDEAAADVDLQRLDDIVRQLQPIEGRLQQDLAECRVEATAGGAPQPGQPQPGEPQPGEPQPGEPQPGEPQPTAGPS